MLRGLKRIEGRLAPLVLALCLAGSVAAGGRDPRAATIEALALLQSLLRQDTTNPPGNEVRAARVLAVFFSDQGIGCELIEPEPGRGNLLCRVKGSGPGRPLLIVAQLDVAAAGGGGRDTRGVRDDRVCGPGVLTGKGMAAATAEALSLVARQGPPARDILFLGAADGESADDWGLKWLLEHRPELGRVEAALTGGGRLTEAGGQVTAVAIDTGEDFAARSEGLSPCSSPTKAPLLPAICSALATLAPAARVEAVAGPSPAALRLLRQKGVPGWGLPPFALEGAGTDASAGGEECLGLESFELGVRLMTSLLREAVAP